MSSFLYQQSYISIDQIIKTSQIEEIFKLAKEMGQAVESGMINEPLKGKTVAVLFYQPSTRTYSSFVAAANRLGAYVTAIHGMEEYSSVAKGETLEDTIRSIHQTTAADVIVLRHPENQSSVRAASVSAVPIINAGSGTNEHPTQALLDLFTIYENKVNANKLKIVMVGDLLYGRTIKSLSKLLAVCSPQSKITFVSPKELKAPPELVASLRKKIYVEEETDLTKVLKDADVVYMTRVQKEWFEKEGKLAEYERLKQQYVLDTNLVKTMKSKAIIMHPLPRVGEIDMAVDSDERAKYFEQMRFGLYVRMALLKLILIK